MQRLHGALIAPASDADLDAMVAGANAAAGYVHPGLREALWHARPDLLGLDEPGIDSRRIRAVPSDTGDGVWIWYVPAERSPTLGNAAAARITVAIDSTDEDLLAQVQQRLAMDGVPVQEFATQEARRRRERLRKD
ncbi:hypothetical protein AXK60_20490 [Tsukamurella pseudospumae]|uniref:Uncharacterized protein n=1 Tax=Tsukamurella pseudospumae TaxID=239498 RepID=A0A138AV87_9ACTN|nr:hypothetical protein AXK60_20490 [Tsukamurella pseudospumae]